MAVECTPETLEAALEAARTAPGNTLLVLVSPRQAERLYLAMKIADRLAPTLAPRRAGDLLDCADACRRYLELSR